MTMPVILLSTHLTFIALAILSGIAMFWAFSMCDEDDEYNKWD